MKIQVHIYSGGLTGHIAWQFGDAYVSFNRGKKTHDLGSVTIPLPAGDVRGRAQASEPKYGSKEQDEAAYVDAEHPCTSIEITGCDADRGGLFARDFINGRLPYVLWGPDEIGAINCVTSSVMICAVMMPPAPWPAAWESKWGGPFATIAAARLQSAKVDWVGQIIRDPFSELMYVDQFKEMIADWQREQPAALAG